MLEMRPDCERCGRDLPADRHGAFICSFECTFCTTCVDALEERCPNCGGVLGERRPAPFRSCRGHDRPRTLLERPMRVGAALERHPASSERKGPK
jgi:uncharacterized protein